MAEVSSSVASEICSAIAYPSSHAGVSDAQTKASCTCRRSDRPRYRQRALRAAAALVLATIAWRFSVASEATASFCLGSPSWRHGRHPESWLAAHRLACQAVGDEQTQQVAIEEQKETTSPEKPRLAGRLKGKASTRTPPRSGKSKLAAPPREEKGLGVPQLILGSLLALALARLVLGFGGGDNGAEQAYPQAYYWSSSRSVVSVTTTDEYGDRRTTMNEDANVRTNIPGLKSYDRSIAPPEYVPKRALPPGGSLYPLLDFDTFP
mmetsp:Transcript_73187/g.136776  ORF Transcript_73187/g.136776 Transcript_73187/m.136776 type:complete len:265 (+) Transcript_73187:42-836(+)